MNEKVKECANHGKYVMIRYDGGHDDVAKVVEGLPSCGGFGVILDLIGKFEQVRLVKYVRTKDVAAVGASIKSIPEVEVVKRGEDVLLKVSAIGSADLPGRYGRWKVLVFTWDFVVTEKGGKMDYKYQGGIEMKSKTWIPNVTSPVK